MLKIIIPAFLILLIVFSGCITEHSVIVDETYNADVDLNFYNGTIKESFNALVTSDGATIDMNLEQSGGGDLTMQFSDGLTTLDTTPPATIELTAGSDDSPTTNYIYIPQSTKVLTKSTSGFPTDVEHIKISFFLVPSAGFVQTSGPYINQNWNDHLSGTDSQGHLSHMGERERYTGAQYFSGINGNGTDGYLTPTAGNTELIATSGVIYQMHRHFFSDFNTADGNMALVKNWNGDPYHDITNLFDITEDSTGTTIGNNKFFNLTIWGVGNKTGQYSPMLINLPSGFYNTQSGAENDTQGFDDFTIPREFSLDSSTGFLIARITIQMGATWTVTKTVDLRGTTPQTASGGAAGIVTEFADNTFRIFDEADNTKEMAFDVGTNITTGTTRTFKFPGADGTLALTLDVNRDWFWFLINADSGSTQPNTYQDTITITGDGAAETSISGDTLSIFAPNSCSYNALCGVTTDDNATFRENVVIEKDLNSEADINASKHVTATEFCIGSITDATCLKDFQDLNYNTSPFEQVGSWQFVHPAPEDNAYMLVTGLISTSATIGFIPPLEGTITEISCAFDGLLRDNEQLIVRGVKNGTDGAISAVFDVNNPAPDFNTTGCLSAVGGFSFPRMSCLTGSYDQNDIIAFKTELLGGLAPGTIFNLFCTAHYREGATYEDIYNGDF